MSVAKVSAKVEGWSRIKSNLHRTFDNIGKQVEAGLKDAGDLLLARSKELVPLDKGPLRDSGKSTAIPANGGGTKTVVVVSYDTHYAVLQHEVLWFKHLPGRTAKYLEGPSRSMAGVLFNAVARRVSLK